MSANEQQSLEILRQVEEGKMGRKQACELLEVSSRTLCRQLKRYRERGLMALRHGNRGRKPANGHPYEVKTAAQRIMREVLFDFNMAHARDVMAEKYGLAVSRETFRRWCKEINAVKQKRRVRKRPRTHRDRHRQEGMLVQFDGSYHRWFGDEDSCLIAGIDDATGKILCASFASAETVVDCMAALRSIVERYGAFGALYTDRAGVYGGFKRSGFAQVARALGELGTRTLYANSPEAKGRIERLFRTMQDRLIPELRINGIAARETANKYLSSMYVDGHNRRFAVAAADPTLAFRPVDPKLSLDDVFCVKEHRTVAKDHTISVEGERWRVAHRDGVSLAGRRAEVRFLAAGIAASIAGSDVALEKIETHRSDKVAG